MKLHKNLRAIIKKQFGGLKNIPAELRDLIQSINDEYTFVQERFEQYHLLADAMADVIWTMDFDLRILYISPSCHALTGYTAQEMTGMSIDEFCTAESAAQARRSLAREMDMAGKGEQEKGAVFMEFEYRRKDHSTVWTEVSVRFMKVDGEPIGLIGVTRDISARREAEESLRKSEEQYRSMIESIEESYYEVDLAGRYIFVNSAFCRMLGYSFDEIIGMSFKQLVPPESQKKLFLMYQKVFTTGVSEKIAQGGYIRKDGITRHAEGSVSLRYDSRGNRIGFCGIIRDVTEKREMEEALRQSEQKWRLLYNNIPGGSMLIGADRIIADVNHITCEITGYGYDELIGEQCGVICPEDPETCTCPAMKGDRGKVDNVETTIRTRQGGVLPIIKSAQRIQGGEGDVVLINFHDISKMKEAEEALRASEETLRKRNQAIEEDIKTAQRIQRAILSSAIPTLGWIKADCRYLPLEAVGGDYFSFIPLREGGLGVFVGDVSSHGVSAALHLSLVKATSERVCRVLALKPAEFITTLNEELFGNMPLSFLTATYGVFTTNGPGEGCFTFSSAGHPHPILVRAGGGAEYMRCKGTIIGMFEELEFHERSVALGKGDRIFLYTDGIPETINDRKESISYDRLPDMVMACNAPTLEETLDNIIGEINRFRGAADLCDDIVLLGFEYLGT